MTQSFFDQPILNSPYACPTRHWDLDGEGQPSNRFTGGDTPKVRNLWERIGKKLPKRGRNAGKSLDPFDLPAELLKAHPKVRADVKNQNPGLEVPCLTGSCGSIGCQAPATWNATVARHSPGSLPSTRSRRSSTN